eukprot:Awhi_evm2s396
MMNVRESVYPIRNNNVITFTTLEKRKRGKEDYFTFFVDVDYIYNCNYSDNIGKFMEDITLNKKDLENVIREYTASGFVPYKHFKNAIIETGGGDNAKSACNEIRECIFGRFYCSISNDVIGERASSSAGSAKAHLTSLINKRIGTSCELGRNEKLNGSLIKAITGGDSQWVRDLFQPGKTVKEVNFKSLTMIIQLNDLPEISRTEGALINRFIIVPFNAQFIIDKEDFERSKIRGATHTFLADPEFIEINVLLTFSNMSHMY